MQCNYCTPGYLTKRNESIIVYNDVYSKAHSTLILQWPQTRNNLSVHLQVNGYTLWHIHTMEYYLKKKLSITSSNLDESGHNYAECSVTRFT